MKLTAISKKAIAGLMAVMMIAAVSTVSAFAAGWESPDYDTEGEDLAPRVEYLFYYDNNDELVPSPHGQGIIRGYDINYDENDDVTSITVYLQTTKVYGQNVWVTYDDVNYQDGLVVTSGADGSEFIYESDPDILDEDANAAEVVIENPVAVGGVYSFGIDLNLSTYHDGARPFVLQVPPTEQ
jgi:hypothetical protein